MAKLNNPVPGIYEFKLRCLSTTFQFRRFDGTQWFNSKNTIHEAVDNTSQILTQNEYWDKVEDSYSVKLVADIKGRPASQRRPQTQLDLFQ